MIEKMATTCNIDPDKGSKPQHKRKKEKHVYRERKSPTYVVKVSAKIRNLGRWIRAGCLTTLPFLCSQELDF